MSFPEHTITTAPNVTVEWVIEYGDLPHPLSAPVPEVTP